MRYSGRTRWQSPAARTRRAPGRGQTRVWKLPMPLAPFSIFPARCLLRGRSRLCGCPVLMTFNPSTADPGQNAYINQMFGVPVFLLSLSGRESTAGRFHQIAKTAHICANLRRKVLFASFAARCPHPAIQSFLYALKNASCLMFVAIIANMSISSSSLSYGFAPIPILGS
jgi:hypothetical protein